MFLLNTKKKADTTNIIYSSFNPMQTTMVVQAKKQEFSDLSLKLGKRSKRKI